MAKTVSGNVSAGIRASWRKDLDIGALGNAPTLSFDQALANGDAANQINNAIADTGTVSDGAPVTVDLDGGTDPGGDTVNATAVKALLIKNASSSGSGFTVGGTFDSWLGASGDAVKVMPGGMLLLVAPSAGYAVTADTADGLTITAVSEDQDYEVIVLLVE